MEKPKIKEVSDGRPTYKKTAQCLFPIERPPSPLRMVPPTLAVGQRPAHGEGDAPYLAEASKTGRAELSGHSRAHASSFILPAQFLPWCDVPLSQPASSLRVTDESELT